MRSERANDPTLSWPAAQPVARCTIATSSVSPERAETIAPQPTARAASSAAWASVTVPAWFTLISAALQAPMPRSPNHALGVRDQVVVADDLHAFAEAPRELDEAGFVVLGQRILDRDDRVARKPAGEEVDHAAAVELAALEAEPVAAVAAELRGRNVERDRHVLAGTHARAFDRAHEIVERLLVGREHRPEAAFVGDASKLAGLGHEFACRAVDLGDHRQRLREALRADGHDHEVLDVDAPPGVRTTAEDLDLRHRQRHRASLREPRPRRQPGRARGGVEARQRQRDDRVAAQSRLVGCAVGGDQRTIDLRLIRGIESHDRARQRSLRVLDRTVHAVAAEDRSPVAQVDGLVAAARRTGGRDAATGRATGEPHFGLDRRAAARVVDGTRVNGGDLRGAHRARLVADSASAVGVTAASATTGFFSTPMPSTSISTVSPGCIGPTPAGVPVMMTSPGSSVMAALR